MCGLRFVGETDLQGDSMVNVLLVGAGGFLGAVFRYIAGQGVHRFLGGPWFPFGTLAVNILGCLMIGFLGGVVENKGWLSRETELLLIVGVLGGFTTFSSFGYETLLLLRQGYTAGAAANVAVSILAGLAAVFGGYKIACAI